jgi:alkyl hydroperoxide reductase subunit AhpC
MPSSACAREVNVIATAVDTASSSIAWNLPRQQSQKLATIGCPGTSGKKRNLWWRWRVL